MKKTILTLSGIIAIGFAQPQISKTITTNPPTIEQFKKDFAQTKPKPVYSLDTSKTIQITLKLSLNKLNDFLITEQRGPQNLMVSKDLSGYQINQIAFHYKAVLDSVNSALTSFIKKDQEKFNADTTALYHK
jgi:hypothetical protein